jgi:hypothetical protein
MYRELLISESGLIYVGVACATQRVAASRLMHLNIMCRVR